MSRLMRMKSREKILLTHKFPCQNSSLRHFADHLRMLLVSIFRDDPVLSQMMIIIMIITPSP